MSSALTPLGPLKEAGGVWGNADSDRIRIGDHMRSNGVDPRLGVIGDAGKFNIETEATVGE